MANLSRPQWFAGAGIVAVLIVLIAAIAAIDSPAEARAKKFDQTRISDLKGIDRGIEVYVREQGELPEELTDLEDERMYAPTSLTDPETDTLYGYETTGEWSYQLCARFGAEYQPEEYHTYERYDGPWVYEVPETFIDGGSPSINEVRTYTERDWYYEPGEWCFDRDVEDIAPRPLSFGSGAEDIVSVPAGTMFTHTIEFERERPKRHDLTFQLINSPQGMVATHTQNSAQISWRPSTEDIGTHEISMMVETDSEGAQSYFTVVVTE